jgi:hypothetical protein
MRTWIRQSLDTFSDIYRIFRSHSSEVVWARYQVCELRIHFLWRQSTALQNFTRMTAGRIDRRFHRYLGASVPLMEVQCHL